MGSPKTPASSQWAASMTSKRSGHPATPWNPSMRKTNQNPDGMKNRHQLDQRASHTKIKWLVLEAVIWKGVKGGRVPWISIRKRDQARGVINRGTHHWRSNQSHGRRVLGLSPGWSRTPPEITWAHTAPDTRHMCQSSMWIDIQNQVVTVATIWFKWERTQRIVNEEVLSVALGSPLISWNLSMALSINRKAYLLFQPSKMGLG